MNDLTAPAWYKKLKSPPADVLYAHKLGRGKLLFEQIEELVKAINPAYVAKKQSNSYLAHHQARAEMNRIFGYGNWDVDVLDIELIYETALPGTGNKSDTTYYRACYRGKSVVTVRDLWGMPVASYAGVHAEANSNLPDRGEAHAMALTSLESYALRRALINMGDRFGLGLYNGGSMNPHGQYTVQLQDHVLFDWTDANLDPIAIDNAAGQPVVRVQPVEAPFVQPTHDTIKAEPVLGDTDVYEEPDAVNTTSDGDSAPAAPRPKRQTAAQKKAAFDAARETVQAANQAARDSASPGQPPQQGGGYPAPADPEAMRERLQAGFKVDDQGAAGGPANV